MSESEELPVPKEEEVSLEFPLFSLILPLLLACIAVIGHDSHIDIMSMLTDPPCASPLAPPSGGRC